MSVVVPEVCSSGLGLNPNAPQFVPSSLVTKPPGCVGLPTGFVHQQPYSNASLLAPRDTLEQLGTSQSLDFNPQQFVPGGQQATPMYATSSFNPAMDSTRVISDLAAQLYVSRIPVPESPVFSGDLLDYASWKSAFMTLIEQKQTLPAEQIRYLKRYLGGKARECREGYFCTLLRRNLPRQKFFTTRDSEIRT